MKEGSTNAVALKKCRARNSWGILYTPPACLPAPVKQLAESPPELMLTGESPSFFLECFCASAGFSLSGVKKFSIQAECICPFLWQLFCPNAAVLSALPYFNLSDGAWLFYPCLSEMSRAKLNPLLLLSFTCSDVLSRPCSVWQGGEAGRDSTLPVSVPELIASLTGVHASAILGR